jgi:hypothetical protein
LFSHSAIPHNIHDTLSLFCRERYRVLLAQAKAGADTHMGTNCSVTVPAKEDIGGTLTLLTAIPAEAAEILIRRETPVTQEIELYDNAPLHTKTIEQMADKAAVETQDIKSSIGICQFFP